MSAMTVRNKKMMLAGLFLSKFNAAGVHALGYNSFNEAYHGLAAVVGGPWRSVKQYRDEFDPVFDNGRKGWHKRDMHPTRTAFLKEFGGLDLEEFSQLVQTQFAGESDVDLEVNHETFSAGIGVSTGESFASRMMTGRGAENYFEEHYCDVPRFAPCSLKRTTDWGCGFDFKLTPPHGRFLAVEVKGIKKSRGRIQLTDKEYKMASTLQCRFFLYVVTRFPLEPKPLAIENPLHAGISFECRTSLVEQRVWTANVSAGA